MNNIYEKVLGEYVNLEDLSDGEIKNILDELGRDAVYNCLIFGNDMTFQTFLKNFKVYLELMEKTH